MFIISALYKQGPFHAAKVRILLIMCNFLMVKTTAISTMDFMASAPGF